MFFSIVSVTSSQQCPINFKCVPIADCKSNVNDGLLYPCDVLSNFYCCPDKIISNVTTQSRAKFPSNCGIIIIDNKITGKI